MEAEYSGYNPLCDHLEEEFGTEFLIEMTGGGCHAIIAKLPSGYQVWLTMAVDVLETYRERVAADEECHRAGWAAGVTAPQMTIAKNRLGRGRSDARRRHRRGLRASFEKPSPLHRNRSLATQSHCTVALIRRRCAVCSVFSR